MDMCERVCGEHFKIYIVFKFNMLKECEFKYMSNQGSNPMHFYKSINSTFHNLIFSKIGKYFFLENETFFFVF